ncbi:MAG TPA: T9SS type A sorting domain-containing protein [Flavobacterium sp.]|uniref:T9SS type A sorting domain-containing protein n=1 Tax=Flavobacterium sp. TaxID=239 RepID=UPI002C1EC088|nr:T9SS type A sorting domain-containing protein [Flavobacterium sp.]HSD14284.1 T9SS type A sorting domain-containing protein [Flavobacterium sp.]
MRNIYFLLAVLCLYPSVNAQIINIPDANFKAKLLSASPSVHVAALNLTGSYVKIDTNDDGEIQVSEAAVIRMLVLNNTVATPDSQKITDLTGITSFTNLNSLSCDYNLLTSLDVSAMPLNVLFCQYNQLSQISLPAGLMNYLYVSHNQLTQLSLPNFVINFDCSYNQLNRLDLANCPALDIIRCNNNQLTELLLPQSGLHTLDCSNNLLTYLDVTPCGSFYDWDVPCYLTISNNPLATLRACFPQGYAAILTMTGIPALQNIYCKPISNNYFQTRLNQNGYTSCVVSDGCALGLEDFEQAAVSVYPNPVTNILNIETKQNIQVLSICIYNQLGQLVLEIPKADNVSKADVSGLASGNYFIKINSDKGTSNTKFIKQ